MSELLHEELDRHEIPFRSTQAELVELHGGEGERSHVVCRLPETENYVPTQNGLMWFRADRTRGFDQSPSRLRAEANDFAAVVADLTVRFGDPQVGTASEPGTDPTTVASWKMGRSKIVVTAASVLEAGETGRCTIAMYPGYVRPHTDREQVALASFHKLYEHASTSFGWTRIDDRNVLMQLNGSHVTLTDPGEIDRLVVQEAFEARAQAFSALSCRLADGKTYLGLGSDTPGRFTAIAAELAEHLQLEVETNEGPST